MQVLTAGVELSSSITVPVSQMMQFVMIGEEEELIGHLEKYITS